MEFLAGSAESGQVGEIRGVHHQRIAFPMANRVALILANLLRDMRTPIRWNHSRRVVDLVQQNHVSWAFDYLQQVVVSGPGKHGDTLLRHQDATLLQRPVRSEGTRLNSSHMSISYAV